MNDLKVLVKTLTAIHVLTIFSLSHGPFFGDILVEIPGTYQEKKIVIRKEN